MSCSEGDEYECTHCNYLEDSILDLENTVEELRSEIELLKRTHGVGYEYAPSTATTIKSMDGLRKWVDNHNKAQGRP